MSVGWTGDGDSISRRAHCIWAGIMGSILARRLGLWVANGGILYMIASHRVCTAWLAVNRTCSHRCVINVHII